MNGKKVKKLRGIARRITVGKENAKYEDRALNSHKPASRTRFLYDCTRLVYLNLKRSYRAGNIKI